MIYEIKTVAKEIESKFDYSNTISFGGNHLKDAYGISLPMNSASSSQMNGTVHWER